MVSEARGRTVIINRISIEELTFCGLLQFTVLSYNSAPGWVSSLAYFSVRESVLRSALTGYSRTRNSAIADGPRDALCQSKSCQL